MSQHSLRPRRRLILASSIFASAFLCAASSLHAASGTWTNASGGTWGTTTNWSGGAVADGAGFTADFSTLDITANRTVTVDSDHALGTLKFKDADETTPFNWTLSGANGKITLDNSGSAAVIDVAGNIQANTTGGNTTAGGLDVGTVGFNKTGTGTFLIQGGYFGSGLVKVSTGTLTLAQSSAATTTTFTGSYQVEAGATLNIAGPGANSGSGNLFASSGAGSSTVTLNGGTLAFNRNNGYTINQAISGTGGSININGTTGGTGPVLALGGTDTYTGNTTVNSGTLSVTGSLTGTKVSVNNGGTLGGTGTITTQNQDCTFASGAKLDPGTKGSVGLTVATGTANLDLSAAIPGNTGELLFTLGTTSDKLTLSSGFLNIGSGADALNFADFTFTAGTGFGAGTYVLFDTNQPITGSLAASGLSGQIGGLNATLSMFADGTGGQDIVLTVVPEPGAVVSLLGGVGMLLGLRRRRY
jgi:autotransporter-associated beta strand protein